MRNIDMNDPADYEFPFEIGLKPEVNIGDLSKVNLTFYKVKVTDEMINEEIERLQNRHGKMLDPETVTTEENVLNVNLLKLMPKEIQCRMVFQKIILYW